MMCYDEGIACPSKLKKDAVDNILQSLSMAQVSLMQVPDVYNTGIDRDKMILETVQKRVTRPLPEWCVCCLMYEQMKHVYKKIDISTSCGLLIP